MKILMVASECVPFAKTGGLADVVGALPKSLKAMGADVRIMLPLYREVASRWREQTQPVCRMTVNLGWRRQYCGILRLDYEGIPIYFVDNEYYFDRPSLYGYGGDEAERFCFFDRAVLESLPQIGFLPDVLHLHDWQAGMIAALLKRQYHALPLYQNIKTVFTVHNLQYQGVFGIDAVEELLGLGQDMYTADTLEFYGSCSLMKAGLVFADEITTVSPTYAKEIQTPYYGERLEGVLRARAGALHGVLNGIDAAEYDPAHDPLIVKSYTAETRKQGKAENKAALQAELGLPSSPDTPLIGMVGRLSPQKGLDLIEYVLGDLMKEDVQLAVLGMGDDRFVNLFSWAAFRYPDKCASRIEMNHGLAHRIYAGADLFLMPSQFEPCGLSQMIAMRYGTVPVARETGGLKDTVFPFAEDGSGNGYTFFSYNGHDMLGALNRALADYRHHPDIFETLVQNGMAGDYSWDAPAGKYMELYEALAGTL